MIRPRMSTDSHNAFTYKNKYFIGGDIKQLDETKPKTEYAAINI